MARKKLKGIQILRKGHSGDHIQMIDHDEQEPKTNLDAQINFTDDPFLTISKIGMPGKPQNLLIKVRHLKTILEHFGYILAE